MPLPEAFRARLGPKLSDIGTTSTNYLSASGAALVASSAPASLAAFDLAIEAYGKEVAALRAEGLTRSLPGDIAERFFAVGFALEQLHQNFKDLTRCVTEWAQPV